MNLARARELGVGKKLERAHGSLTEFAVQDLPPLLSPGPRVPPLHESNSQPHGLLDMKRWMAQLRHLEDIPLHLIRMPVRVQPVLETLPMHETPFSLGF